MREAERTEPFGEAVERSLEARRERRKSTLADLRSYAGRMVRHGDWAGKPLRGIGVEECREMLSALFGHSPWAFRKGRSVLHSVFAYGVRNGWCERNPVDAIEAPRVVEQRIEALGLEEIRRLMEVCKGSDMEAAVAIMLWCGARPGEVQRLTWEDVDTQEGVLYVPPQHSKTGGARLVPLRGPASKLRMAENRQMKISPPQLGEEVAGAAGARGVAPLAPGCAAAHLREHAPAPLLQPAAPPSGNGPPGFLPPAHPLYQLAWGGGPGAKWFWGQ